MELEKDEEITMATVGSVETQLIQGVDIGIIGKSLGWARVYLTNKRLIIGETRGSSPIILPLNKSQQFKIDKAWLRGVYNKILGRKTIRIKYVDKNRTKEISITGDRKDIATLFEKLKEFCPSKPTSQVEETGTKPSLTNKGETQKQEPIRPGW